MSSTGKRIGTITPPVSLESPSKKKLSRRIRYNKNKKLKWEREHAEKTRESEESIPPVATPSTELDIVFNPLKVLILFLPR
jgi:hypothetical protein